MKQANTSMPKPAVNGLTEPGTGATAARFAETARERPIDSGAGRRFKDDRTGQVQAYHLFGAA